MTYSLLISRSAQKALGKLPVKDYPKVKAKIESLADDPRPPGSKKLKGRDGWRVRSGNYRIIYEIEDNELIIKVIRIRHRKNAYE